MHKENEILEINKNWKITICKKIDPPYYLDSIDSSV